MNTQTVRPIDVVDLLPVLDRKLIDLMKSLTPEEWKKQTIAKLWTVKDVVAHLLDGNIRVLSMLRDHYYGEQTNATTYPDLVDYLNGLNADWVKAMKRVSPTMLIYLHEMTGPSYCSYYKSLQPFDTSPFAVNWAGETQSTNRMHIAREYTEKWLHQQQIRDAIGNTDLMTKEFFYPFIDIFMMGLPHTYRNISVPNGTVIKLTISSEIGGFWFLMRSDHEWNLQKSNTSTPSVEIIIDPDTSWKLFSKSLRPDQILPTVTILGDVKLGEVALSMVSVMA
ncbi:MAG: maleylpyruvate isomerase N-terminal domain-containing protein [Saprospiraceae bacterium]|nr:maleylpyruvate isomerase N-terminal domain-containing protein [Saprospiraceae bacterium]